MRRITVELDEQTLEQLRELAKRERRDVRQQASWELARVVEQARARQDTAQ